MTAALAPFNLPFPSPFQALRNEVQASLGEQDALHSHVKLRIVSMHSKLQQCSRLAVSSPSPQQKDIARLADLHFRGDWTNSSLLHFLAFPLSRVPLLGVAFDFHRLRQSRSLRKAISGQKIGFAARACKTMPIRRHMVFQAILLHIFPYLVNPSLEAS